jgi:histone acetyltransferase 1
LQEGSNRKFEVFLADESVPGFRDFHARLQPWIMFFIDAASYIDIDDNNWRFFTL